MATYGFGPAVERWGGFLSDLVCVPFAQHMLVPLPAGLEPSAVASAFVTNGHGPANGNSDDGFEEF